ncbi:chorion protein S38 [Drosophila innubila]|uniref:chorion protein S38 n=1 Tax=Drosophila innubila TaxID=198719 RepID=UPI00148C216E|nr:chorion protein S38 [Drosophila innubila]
MNRHSFVWALAACLIACASANGYGGQQSYGSGGQGYGSSGQQSYSNSGDGAAAGASAGGAGEFANDGALSADGAAAGSLAGNGEAAGLAQTGQSTYGSDQNIPYKPVNTKGNTLTSSITYPQNKGEILIHRPAPIIVRRPPTKVLVNHPPLVVKPAPVVLHKPPAIVLRKVYVKHHPRRVKVEPVFVNVVKPPAEKYFVNENKQGYGQASHGHAGHSGHSGHGHGHGHGNGHHGRPGPIVAGPQHSGPALPAYASGADSAAASAGYQLLQGGNHGLSALANIAGEREGNYGGQSHQYGGPAQSGPGAYSAPSY